MLRFKLLKIIESQTDIFFFSLSESIEINELLTDSVSESSFRDVWLMEDFLLGVDLLSFFFLGSSFSCFGPPQKKLLYFIKRAEDASESSFWSIS